MVVQPDIDKELLGDLPVLFKKAFYLQR